LSPPSNPWHLLCRNFVQLTLAAWFEASLKPV
jgi:hypothetical protein